MWKMEAWTGILVGLLTNGLESPAESGDQTFMAQLLLLSGTMQHQTKLGRLHRESKQLSSPRAGFFPVRCYGKIKRQGNLE